VGYHRDLQLLKDILFPATTEIKRTLAMCDFMLAHIRVNEHILDDKKYDYLFTVEDVNRMVLAGTPFREAYKQVGMAVQRGEYTPTREVHHTHEGSIGNLCTAQIRRKMERVDAGVRVGAARADNRRGGEKQARTGNRRGGEMQARCGQQARMFGRSE